MPHYIWMIWVEPVETRDVSHSSKGLGTTVLVPEDSWSVAGLQGQWAVGTVGCGDSGPEGQWAVETVGCEDSGLWRQKLTSFRAGCTARLLSR